MNRPLETTWLHPDDYLDGEKHSEVRHEYVAGSVYAMSGASEEHNLIAGNFFAVLKLHLRGGPCRVFISDMKTHIDPGPADACQDRFYSGLSRSAWRSALMWSTKMSIFHIVHAAMYDSQSSQSGSP